jgi:16S rRNA (guanine966-N2)-methyltransferase
MRVIGGRSRGRRLVAKLPPSVRPTSDRVRESIFDILGSQGGVEGLSRGAASSTFVDLDPDALAAVRRNLEAVGLAGEAATLVRASLPGWLQAAGGREPFDLALCDPPYDFADWPALLGALRAETAVMESSSVVPFPEGWVVTRERRYGGTLVTVAHRSGAGS